MKLFTAVDFIADLTVHLPPKGKHLIRYYRLYASRTKGRARQDGRYEKLGIKKNEMKIVAIIQDRSEIEKIIACLEKKNKALPVVENVS